MVKLRCGKVTPVVNLDLVLCGGLCVFDEIILCWFTVELFNDSLSGNHIREREIMIYYTSQYNNILWFLFLYFYVLQIRFFYWVFNFSWPNMYLHSTLNSTKYNALDKSLTFAKHNVLFKRSWYRLFFIYLFRDNHYRKKRFHFKNILFDFI